MPKSDSAVILRPQARWGVITLGVVLGLTAGAIQSISDQDMLFTFFVPLVLAGWGAAVVAAFGFNGEGLDRGRAVTFLIGVLYAFWGYPVGLCGWLYGSAPLSSLVWAAALTVQFGRHAWLPMLLLGVSTSVLGHTLTAKSNLVSDWLGASTMIWHLGHPVAIYFAARGRIHSQSGHLVNNTCANCGYSRTGLPSPVCPECGTLTTAG